MRFTWVLNKGKTGTKTWQ